MAKAIQSPEFASRASFLPSIHCFLMVHGGDDDEDGDYDEDGDDDDKDFTSRASSHPSIVFTGAQYSGTPMAAADVEVCSKNRRFLHHSVLQKLFFLN